MSVPTSLPPLLLIHGAWQGAWVWTSLAECLRPLGWTCHAIDLPGNGNDDTPAEAVNLDCYVRHAADWLDRQPGPVVVVGHSGGGVVASQLAEARPDKVAALVYLAGMMLPSGMGFGQLVQEALAEYPEAAGIGRYLAWSADRSLSSVPEAAAKEIFFHDCPDAVAAAGAARLVAQPEEGRALVAQLSPERWGRVPRLYVEALEDRSVILPLQRRMQALCPGARRVSIATGHAPHVAAPHRLAPLLDEALRDLLRHD
ncbi:alpha/beta fold hydrolase [Denitratisoma sp. agr-D3]